MQSRAPLYCEQDNFSKAIGDYSKIVELNPNNAKAYLNRGLLYVLVKKPKEAMHDIDKSIKIDPKLAEKVMKLFENKKQARTCKIIV